MIAPSSRGCERTKQLPSLPCGKQQFSEVAQGQSFARSERLKDGH